MVYSDWKKLWLVVVEYFHSSAALHYLHLAIEGDCTCASRLICYNIVSSTFGLELKFDIQERKSEFLVWYSIALIELVIDKQFDCSQLILGERILGVSKGQIRYWFR